MSAASHLQEARQQVGEVLQQSRVALVGQDEGRRGASRQRANLKDHFKLTLRRIIQDRISLRSPSGREGAHLWVGLVLHALDQHALDDLHVVLLLVAKDPREVPDKRGHTAVNP